jgi:hypothetical protein
LRVAGPLIATASRRLAEVIPNDVPILRLIDSTHVPPTAHASSRRSSLPVRPGGMFKAIQSREQKDQQFLAAVG